MSRWADIESCIVGGPNFIRLKQNIVSSTMLSDERHFNIENVIFLFYYVPTLRENIRM